jgi:uncharacterized membrane protein
MPQHLYSPITLPYLGLLGIVLAILIVMLEIGVIEAAYEKLGMSHRAVTGLLLLTIFGSYINVPVAAIHAGSLIHNETVIVNGVPYVVPDVQLAGKTIIAINVGGALIPILLSTWLLIRVGGILAAIPSTAIVAAVVNHLSELVPGVGIAVPTFIPGLLAALVAIIFTRRYRASVAYTAGTIGCLIGADILNLGAVARLHAPVASIGGAGTFDGVFVSGIIAVLLA